MNKLTTSHDRIIRATGENSSINWDELPEDVAAALLDKIKGGKNEEDIPDTPTASSCQERIVHLFGYDMTFSQALQLTSVILQVLSLLFIIVLAIKSRK